MNPHDKKVMELLMEKPEIVRKLREEYLRG